MGEFGEISSSASTAGGEEMRAPDDVETMLRLKALGWGAKRIAAELGCSRNTVKRYLRHGRWIGYQAPNRRGALDDHADWLAERFRQHRGNADVLRQELAKEFGIKVSLRTVERSVQPFRRELAAEAAATVRFETVPGRQLQIDFGSAVVSIGDEVERVFLFVATLGYSRRNFVLALHHERQSAWFDGLEAAFRHFGGITREVLLDNARALVQHHNPATREIVFNERFHAFCRSLGFPAARLRTLPSPDQGQGRERRQVREAQCHRRSEVRQLGGPRSTSRRLDARCRRYPHSRHDRRAADRPVRARRSGGPQAAEWPPAIPATSRGHASGAGG